MDLSQYKDLFLTEAREHLSILNNSALALEKEPENPSHIEQIFRSVHTIKGMAATMGFDQVSTYCHELENILDNIRSKEVRITPSFIDTLLNSLDILESLVEQETSEEGTDADASNIVRQLHDKFDRVTEIKGESGEDVVEEEVLENVGDGNMFSVRIFLDKNCLMKSVRVFMVFRKFREEGLGEVISAEPAEEHLMQEEFEDNFHLIVKSDKSSEVIKNELESILEIDKVSVKSVSSEGDAEPETEKGAMPFQNGSIQRLESKIKEGVRDIRISIERLDSLMALVGELVIVKGRLQQLGSKYKLEELTEVISNFDRLTQELQNEVMQSRMVPIKQVFDRFPRLVRDAKRALNKQVELVVQGEDIELDRSMLDQIGDPLVHLIRNSIDHGIESPEERVKRGKPPAGTIRLVADRQKENVIVYVEDDGKGIDKERVKEKALERGLINYEDLSQFDDSDVINLITMPGFSTADEVTDVSGRGVGLDVVKMQIKSLGGSLEIDSTPGEGTKITLKLPVTLAIMQAMMVKVGDETYAIPISHTQEAVELTNKNLKTIKRKEVLILDHRETILPFVRLMQKLNVPEPSIPVEKGNKLSVVVVETAKKQVALLVDELIGQEDIVVKTLDPIFNQVKEVTGVTITGEGDPAFILNVPSIVN